MPMEAASLASFPGWCMSTNREKWAFPDPYSSGVSCSFFILQYTLPVFLNIPVISRLQPFWFIVLVFTTYCNGLVESTFIHGCGYKLYKLYFTKELHNCFLKEGECKLFTSLFLFSVFCWLCTFCLHVAQAIFVLHHQSFARCVPVFPLHLCQHFLHLTYSVAVCSVIYEPEEPEKQNFRLHCKAQCYCVPFIGEAIARKLYFWHLGLQHALVHTEY